MRNRLFTHCSEACSALLFVLGMLWTDAVFSQNHPILSGRLLDGQTKEAMPFANVYDTAGLYAASTDSNGYFQFALRDTNTCYLCFSMVGYTTYCSNFILPQQAAITIRLQPDVRLAEVTVTSQKFSKTAEQNTSGLTTLTAATLERLPNFLGEKDILKAAQLTPGIQSGQEGARGLFVRGGSPDQNLLLFHQATVYNVSHVYGFLSVFTTEALDKMDIHKNYIPAQYGGRLSSVLDIQPNFGNTEKWKGGFSFGAITAKLYAEGPLKKGTTSMNISLRECHIGLFTGPLSRRQFEAAGDDGELKYYFYDLNAALQHKVNEKNTLRWSLYNGSDFYTFGQSQEYIRPNSYYKDINRKKLSWGNLAQSLAWETKWKKITLSHFYTYSLYQLRADQLYKNISRRYNRISNEINQTDYDTRSNISEHGLQSNLHHRLHPNHELLYGYKWTHRTYTINNVNIINRDSLGNIRGRDTLSYPKVRTNELYVYLDYIFSWKDKFMLKTGGQLLSYHVNGKHFFYPQPRAEMQYYPVKGWTLRASVMHTVQPMHLLTNNTGDIQNDVWVPATRQVEPETAWQYSGGLQYNHPAGYTVSVDGYYKKMKHLSEYRYGSTFLLDNVSWEDQLLNSGIGEAYGMEVFFAKSKGAFTSWVKYNLGWSTRQYPEINEGLRYFYKYDRRHDISIVLQYKLKKHFDFSVAWTYGTGWRITTPAAQYATDGTLFDYDQANQPITGGQSMDEYWNYRNNYTLPAYHHLDIGMNYTKKGKRVTHQLNVSVYNVYNHLNVFSVYREMKRDANDNPYKQYQQLSLFPILPSFGYTITFEKP